MKYPSDRYIRMAPVVFFTPLSVAHRAMNEARAQLLLEIDERFCREYDRIRQMMSAERPDLDDSVHALEELQTLHGMVAKFPVWPFNSGSIARFTTSYVMPVALALVMAAIERVI
jgi:hypothetical protein